MALKLRNRHSTSMIIWDM